MDPHIIKNEEKAFYKTQYPYTINPPPLENTRNRRNVSQDSKGQI